jgi:glycosyltransferase involved in cell wall biosynthesis
VIPLFNKEKEVIRAVNSVLSQTISNFEIIVVNDGSSDKGPDLVRAVKDPRIKVIDQANSGVSAARNRGIAESYAELIAFLDADDEWQPDFLETIIGLRNKFPSCEVFATNYLFRRSNNYSRPTIIRGLPSGFREGILTDYFKIASQSDPPLWTSAVAVTKRAIQSVGGFLIGVIAGEDLLTWAKLAVEYKIAYTVDPKAYFWEPVQLSDRPERMPNEPDIVGNELKKLSIMCHENKCNGLREYMGLWHKNRTSIYIRRGERLKALREILKAVTISGLNCKLLMYMIGAFLPKALTINMITFIRYRRYR